MQRIAFDARAGLHDLSGSAKVFQRRALVGCPALNMVFDLHARARFIGLGQIVENLFASWVDLRLHGLHGHADAVLIEKGVQLLERFPGSPYSSKLFTKDFKLAFEVQLPNADLPVKRSER